MEGKSWWLLWAHVPSEGTSRVIFQNRLQASWSAQDWILLPKGGRWSEFSWGCRCHILAAMAWEKTLSLLESSWCPSIAPASFGSSSLRSSALQDAQSSMPQYLTWTLSTDTQSHFQCPKCLRYFLGMADGAATRGRSGFSGHLKHIEPQLVNKNKRKAFPGMEIIRCCLHVFVVKHLRYMEGAHGHKKIAWN